MTQDLHTTLEKIERYLAQRRNDLWFFVADPGAVKPKESSELYHVEYLLSLLDEYKELSA